MVAILTAVLLSLANEKEVIFKLKERGNEQAKLDQIARAASLTPPQRVFRHAGKFEARHAAFGLDRWYTAEAKALPDDSIKALEAQSSMVSQPSLSGAERMLGTPNDPRYSSQAHFPAVGMPTAWDISTGDPSVVVAGEQPPTSPNYFLPVSLTPTLPHPQSSTLAST